MQALQHMNALYGKEAKISSDKLLKAEFTALPEKKKAACNICYSIFHQ
jgi:hypothetical protein